MIEMMFAATPKASMTGRTGGLTEGKEATGKEHPATKNPPRGIQRDFDLRVSAAQQGCDDL